jgi:hypothetical protein
MLYVYLLIVLVWYVGHVDAHGAEWDGFVVSTGGAGCTAVLMRAHESHGYAEHSRARFYNKLNNGDHYKHSYPVTFIKNAPIVRYGIIYVVGNATSILKSLSRRHFAHLQSVSLKGDQKWLDAQKFRPFPVEDPDYTVPLFSFVPKKGHGRDHNVSKSLLPVELPGVQRLHRMFAYIGMNLTADPIGVYKHFSAWREVAESGTFPYPILFVSLKSAMTKGTPQFAELDHFINATIARRNDLLYNPHRKVGKRDPKHLEIMPHLLSGREYTYVKRGVSLTEKWSTEMLSYDGRLFPGKQMKETTWTSPILN